MEIINKNEWIMIRIMIIFIIPLFLSLYIFNPTEKITLEKTSNNSFKFPDNYFRPSFKKNIATIFKTPFKFDYFKLCYEDNTSIKSKISKNPEIQITYELIIDNIPYNYTNKNCLTKKIEKETTINKVNGIIEYKNETEILNCINYTKTKNDTCIEINAGINLYAKKDIDTTTIPMVIFYLTWISLMWLLSRAHKLIKFGFFKKT